MTSSSSGDRAAGELAEMRGEIRTGFAELNGRPRPCAATHGADRAGHRRAAELEVVETLQGRLIITVPDEVTARGRTVRDLQDAVSILVAAAPVDMSTGKDNSS
ncbi:hypothetical protein [Streptomyces sp. NPDC002785]|uniref:hypothetical protein n=1 Tax=Streptomyces sp. NPDC002785 TaxID=3154543 RepID=UPI0033294AEB